jgi:hypothetical protein
MYSAYGVLVVPGFLIYLSAETVEERLEGMLHCDPPVGNGVLVKTVVQYFPEPYPYLTIVISIQCHALA